MSDSSLSFSLLFRVVRNAVFADKVYLYCSGVFQFLFNPLGNLMSNQSHLVLAYDLRLDDYADFASCLNCI